MALSEKLTAIGDAIRRKTGSTDALTMDQMVNEIGAISSVDTTMEDMLVGDSKMTTYSNDRVTTLGNYLFQNNARLESVSFPNLTEIGDNVFEDCTYLMSVNAPNVVTIRSNVFYGCTKLTSISFPNMIYASNNAFRGCTNLVDVTVQSMKSIGMYLFRDCAALKKLDFHSTELSTMGTSTFQGCSNLTTLILRQTKVVTNSSTSTFKNTPIESGTGLIYVPDDLVESYKVATNWITFSEQFRAIEDYPEICGGVT